jgi:uracil-DNA glycosylase
MKKVLFVGQAMPAVKRHPHHWPSLNLWLYSIGLTDTDIQENFLYTALVDYFPGYKNKSHRAPSKEEIKKERERLKKIINGFNPEIVVSIGKLSIANCLGVKEIVLSDHIGKSYKINPYNLYQKEVVIIPLPHPSGASTWVYKEGNRALLQKALLTLKKEVCS